MNIEAMYISPVKSLALQPIERAALGKAGVPGDRAFHIVDADGKLFTQRDHFPLVQVRAAYDAASEELTLTFPEAGAVSGAVERGGPITTPFWQGRPVEGHVVRGPWNDALSSFAGRPLRLVQATPGRAFDGFPLSMCSTASLAALGQAAGVDRVDGRRFRQNVYIEGAANAHEEDTWLGRNVRVGSAVVSVKMQDERCVVTTRSPDTGEHDLNTLKLIATYRTDDDSSDGVHFGVYCTIVEPGDIAIGDQVTPL